MTELEILQKSLFLNAIGFLVNSQIKVDDDCSQRKRWGKINVKVNNASKVTNAEQFYLLDAS